MKTIVIAKDFTDAPGGRLLTDGKWSGQEFRQKHLEPCIEQKMQVLVDLDGVFGYATSFLEEAFGGLSRKYGTENVLKLVNFKSDEDSELIERILGYIKHG